MTTLAEMPILSRFVDILSKAPTPEAIMAIRTTEEEEERLAQLKEKLHGEGLSQDEQDEVRFYLFAEHIVKMAKIKAHARIRA